MKTNVKKSKSVNQLWSHWEDKVSNRFGEDEKALGRRLLQFDTYLDSP